MKVLSVKNPIDIAVEASTILYNSVVHTLGPGGLNTAVVTKGESSYNIINDGYSIIKDLTSPDPVIAPMLETLKQSAFETNRKAGDGTTSTIVLMHNLLCGIKEISSTLANRVQVKEELLSYSNDFIDILHQVMSRDITEEDYKAIATVSLGSPRYSTLIADAYKFLKGESRPSIIKSDIPNIVMEEKDGIVLEKADILLKESLEGQSKEFVDMDVYILYDKIDRWQYIQGLVQQVARMKKKTLLFYNELSLDILENLKYNIVSGIVDIIPIRLGGIGPKLYDTMKEVSVYTGATVIDGVEVKITDLKSINIGSLDYVFMSSDQLIINNKNFDKKEELKLPTKSCIIRVGGTNVIEQEDNYRRIEDAVNSLGNAIDSGITVGSGLSYSRIVDRYSEEDKLPKYIRDAMGSIYKNVMKNLTGKDNIDPDFDGMIPANGEYSLPDALNIWDATKVIEEVIRNSFNIVAQVITTLRIIHNMER